MKRLYFLYPEQRYVNTPCSDPFISKAEQKRVWLNLGMYTFQKVLPNSFSVWLKYQPMEIKFST